MIKNNFVDLNDLIHDIYLNLSKINFDKVQNEQNYVHRAIKIQCWAVLDKITSKKLQVIPETNLVTDRHTPILSEAPSTEPDPHHRMETSQLMSIFLRFKKTLPTEETNLLNAMLDEHDLAFVDVAKRLQLNENTVRTKVRRLRKSFHEYLKENGYV
jgi:DNA-directed RNA polymerase specialized sigma24 family protein